MVWVGVADTVVPAGWFGVAVAGPIVRMAIPRALINSEVSMAVQRFMSCASSRAEVMAVKLTGDAEAGQWSDLGVYVP